MGFFFRNIRTDPSCTSQLLIDGRYVSLDVLCLKRSAALLEFFPCQSPCCIGVYTSSDVHKLPPLKLAISMTPHPTGHLLSFILTRKCRLLRRLNHVLPSSRTPLYSLDITVHKETASIDVHIHLRSSLISLFSFQDNLASHSPTDIAYYLDSVPVTFPSPPSLSPRSVSLSSGDRWSCVELFRSKDRDISPHGIFDDRAPTTDHFGNVFWKGFENHQNVSLRSITLWSAGGVLAGLQVSYQIDGLLRTGPRHLAVLDTTTLHEDVLQLDPVEQICNLWLVLLPSGLCSHLGFKTSKNRSFTAGSKNAVSAHGKQETVFLPNSTRVVAFRGAAESDGLRNFGIVLENRADEPAKIVTSELVKCLVCGAMQHYFQTRAEFEQHVERCNARHNSAVRIDVAAASI